MGPIGSMSFGTTPLGGTTGKREPQIILKTDERNIVLELGLGGKFSAKSRGCDENRIFLEGATRSRSRPRTAAGSSRICRPSRLSPSWSCTYWPDDE
jgi:hypothetical protein